jgi:hypothetical protein
MVKVDHLVFSSPQFGFTQYFFHITHIDAFIYLIMFAINKAWYLGPILQKIIILKVAQNFKN